MRHGATSVGCGRLCKFAVGKQADWKGKRRPRATKQPRSAVCVHGDRVTTTLLLQVASPHAAVPLIELLPVGVWRGAQGRGMDSDTREERNKEASR